ncbi:hypothetical protein [Paraburkholderia aspalathi]|uniref:Endo-1,4-beta-xylanase, GH35 family n=1 Tax=Paraburkholderia aspalathi TaxID=1324617 RepID=A0A1I7ELQ3_9BURK|nr:hypothetical protein [Paraburkholderia aspalathi]SFU24811.1 Endo-1,4-beta-xylanase, GH35 family [Paraburkholderia aspalathi]
MKRNVLRALYFLSVLALPLHLLASQPQITVKSGAPSNVFVATDPEFDTVGGNQTGWTLTNWKQSIIASGVLNGSGKLSFKGMRTGYYKLTIAGDPDPVYFGVLPRIVSSPDNRVASDSAHSWIVPPDHLKLVGDLERLAGLKTVRDRFSWSQIQPTPGPFAWGNYDKSASVMQSNGIETLGVFHDAPKWTRGKFNKLPDNLLALNSFCSAASAHFKGRVSAWEFWNEEDIGFNTDPAWNFAAGQKACYLGFKQGNPGATVLLGSVAQPMKRGSLLDVIFSNGASDYFDVFNFHIYLPSRKPSVLLDKMVDSNQAILNAHSIRKPFWVTEVGLGFEGDGRAKTEVNGQVHAEHDAAQEIEQANALVRSQLMLMALGSQRSFSFIFPPLNEKNKVWGFLRWDYSVKPAYVALANLNYQLQGKSYSGTVDLGNSVTGYLFGGGSDQVLIIPVADRNVLSAKFALGDRVKAYDLMGTPVTDLQTVDGAAIYLRGLNGLVAESTAFAAVYDKAKPSNIVVNLKVDNGFQVKDRVRVVGSDGSAMLDVYNFADQPQTGAITADSGPNDVAIQGLPQSVTLAAKSMRSFPVHLVSRGSASSLRLWTEFAGDRRIAAVVPFASN